MTIGGSPTQGLRVEHNNDVFIAGNTLTFPAKRQMTALDLKGSHGAVVGNSFSGATNITKESPRITLLENDTAADSKCAPTEWKRITGGFAVRMKLKNGHVVALMRGGPTDVPRPDEIEGYGYSTVKDFAWFHVRK